MSAAIHVFLDSLRVPSVDEWNAAIKAEGFELVIDVFDLRKNEGYRAAMLKGAESAFDWDLSAATLFDEDPGSPEKAQISGCDRQARIGYGAPGEEFVAARIAGAVLAKMTCGWFFDNERGGKLIRGEEAIADARIVLAEWQSSSESPAKHIAAAATSVLAPILKALGFMRVKPKDFARVEGGIVQNFWIEKRDAGFRGGWLAMALYPAQEFYGGGITFDALGLRSIKDDRPAGTQAQAEAGMKELADAFLKHIYPALEDTRTDAGYLDHLTEFEGAGSHDLLTTGCLLAKIGRTEEAARKVNQALVKYETYGGSQSERPIAQCLELLGAIQAGTTPELLEKWKSESIENLGLKKLLKMPSRSRFAQPKLAEPPPVITSGETRTSARFSREIVLPAIEAMMKHTLPDFQLAEARGPVVRFMRPGTEGLFDFVTFRREWTGAMIVHLSSSYDSTWQQGLDQQLGCWVGLANLRLGLNRDQLNLNHPAWRESWYHYGRSEEELRRQMTLAGNHLTQHAPTLFTGSRKIMAKCKLVQFGLKQVRDRPLSDAEKIALKMELARAYEKPLANRRFLELRAQLEEYTAANPDISQGEKNGIPALTERLLLANLNLSAPPEEKKEEKGGIWKWFRRG